MMISELIASAGNPVALFALLSWDMPGTFNKVSGNTFQISLFGLIVLAIFGYLYLGVCAIFRMLIKRKEKVMDCIEDIGKSLFPIAVVGLILPVLFLNPTKGDVFVYIIALPALFFALIWIVVSLYAICKSEKSISRNTD